MNTWIEALLIAITSISSALLALMILALVVDRRPKTRIATSDNQEIEQTVFLFDDQNLIDATMPARHLLDATPAAPSDWARLTAFLAPKIANFSEEMSRLAELGRLELRAENAGRDRAPIRVIAEDLNGLARITLIDPEAEGHGILIDGLSQRAMEDELESLRHTLDASPILIWRADATNAIIWANRAYIMRSGALEHSEDSLIWPLPNLFNIKAESGDQAPRRARIEDGTENGAWFDCYRYDFGHESLYFALPADSAVRAEQALRDFVQTLTKTFADLPIGLAIFDRQRQLQLFNPALLDLTHLGPEFLSGRPTLYAFLDRLREARMMPEPKDYRSWRLQMTELENAAATGFHAETWSLPGGQTYRVTGRPHPNGAIAFLFEDISAEISLTRRFRAELELSHEVMDHLPDAVAIFQASGEFAFSNRAYNRLWGVAPDETLGQITFADAAAIWSAHSTQTTLWERARKLVQLNGAQKNLSENISLQDGRIISCHFSALHGGAVMARFSDHIDEETPAAAPSLAAG